MGKGDTRRPAQVSDVTYAANFARTFPKVPTSTEGQGGVMIDFRRSDTSTSDPLTWCWVNTDEGPE